MANAADAAACARYFHENEGYARILEAMRRKYRSLGRAGGFVTLNDATPAECDAARGLFGHAFAPPMRISLCAFEAALQATPYAGVTLRALLEAYFGAPLYTKGEEQMQRRQALTRAVEAVREANADPVCRQWLERLLADPQAEGSRLLRQCVEAGNGQRALGQACDGFCELRAHPGQSLRLAVLSARATTDPHALDGTAPAGKLFLHLLAFAEGLPHPDTAEARDAFFFRCGLLCDSISSSVTQVGLRLETEAGEHPAFAAFRERREPCTLTLTNLLPLTRAESPSGIVYLVENQMVFSQLCDRAAQFHSPLVCTSGQPQVAALRLMDMLAASGA
ncbi:MAG: TIGR02679 domain-containing protein, partial [Eubacteriales bacterium]|nr:TIGR02679 domain-containing protein [Eubacteriales bacterium]